MPKTLIAFGANIGNVKENFEIAFQNIKQFGNIIKISKYYKTKPVGNTNQPDFTNGALYFETQLSPQQLLEKLLEIEKEAGRVRVQKNEPRTLDLDIIFYDDKIIEEENLTIPHPRVYERRFVLEPLNEIAPKFTCPKTGKQISELFKNLT